MKVLLASVSSETGILLIFSVSLRLAEWYISNTAAAATSASSKLSRSTKLFDMYFFKCIFSFSAAKYIYFFWMIGYIFALCLHKLCPFWNSGKRIRPIGSVFIFTCISWIKIYVSKKYINPLIASHNLPVISYSPVMIYLIKLPSEGPFNENQQLNNSINLSSIFFPDNQRCEQINSSILPPNPPKRGTLHPAKSECILFKACLFWIFNAETPFPLLGKGWGWGGY